MKEKFAYVRWYVDEDYMNQLVVAAKDSGTASLICTIHEMGVNGGNFKREEAMILAKLIASAPDLLKCCLEAKAMYEAQGINKDSIIGGDQYLNLLKSIEKATK